MRKLIGVGLLGIAACASDPAGPELLEGFEPPPPGEGEIQIIGPIVRDIAPGADITLCSYLPPDQVFDETMDVIGARGIQSAVGGHHGIVYMVESERPVDTHECTDDDMANTRYLAAAAGGPAGTLEEYIPEGVAFRVEAGRQLMIQTHWINTTTEPIDGQAAFNLRVEPPSADRQLAQLFSWVATEIEIPPNSQGSARTDCVVQQEMKFYRIVGHAHEHGSRVRLSYTPAGGTPTTFYDEAWEYYYTFDPPKIEMNAEEAMIVRPGDTLSVDCDYDNTTGETLTFPLEMCVGAGFFYPGDVQINCVDGRWPE